MLKKEILAVLGEKKPGKDYPERIGVYGLPVTYTAITNRCLIAVAAVTKLHKNGQIDYHLIGGAMEEVDRGKHPETLKREFLEETGCKIQVSEDRDYLHRINEYVDAKTLNCEKIGYFYHVKIIEQIQVPTEPNHRLVVMPIEEALVKLHHPSARLIVEYVMKMNNLFKSE